MSIISYGIILWGASSPENLNSIFKIQKRALRYILNLSNSESCRQHFHDLKLLTVPSLFIFQTILFIRKNANKMPHLGDTHNYNTRNRSSLLIAPHRLKLTETQAVYIGAKLYNYLPQEIKLINNENKFRQTVKDFLINKTCYSVAEFLK